ncbi:MAG TPA: hypothetical protein VGF27_25240 [Pseudoduganella sp.]
MAAGSAAGATAGVAAGAAVGSAAGAAAGAAVWSARQGGAERPKSDWATPVGATTHPEFNPTPTSTDAWPADGEEPAQASARVKGPVLWGLVLLIAAALTFIALWIKGNVATERDLAALARFAHIPSAPTEQAAPRAAPQPVLPAPADKPEQSIAQAPAAVTPMTPIPPTAAASDAGPEAAANRVAETPRTVQPIEARPPAAQTAAPVRQQARQAPAQVRRPPPAARNIVGAPQSPESALARMSPRAKEYLYSRVFRRCPAPGAPGALQCRKHICNGAEGRSPACYHINRLNL